MCIVLYILNGDTLPLCFELCDLDFVLRESMAGVFTFYDYFDLVLSSLHLSGGACRVSVLHPTHPRAHLPVLQAFYDCFSLI